MQYVEDEDEGFIDLHVSAQDIVRNQTGRWFLGVVALKVSDTVLLNETITDGVACNASGITADKIDTDFGTPHYLMRTYTAGCYYFNTSTEVWEARLVFF